MGQQENVRISDFPERLRKARETLKITQENLGKAWGVKGNYIYFLEARRRKFPKKWHSKVLEMEDEVRKKIDTRSLTKYPDEIISKTAVLREEPGGNLLSIGDRAEVRMVGLEATQRKVPVVGFVAGANMLANRAFNYGDLANQIEEEIATESRDPNALGLIVEGDSMDPEIQEGDRIVVAPNAEPRNRDVVVVRLREEGSAMVKRFYRTGPEGRTIRLESTNKVYSDIVKDQAEFRFIYPVVKVERRTRR